ncbi:MAG: protein phosphatase 2C domain-containing protein [Pyrinomonadaceae bacterium]|nr:protein phosphatase 2C domain-containing protein [Pyrinomonadaceae bacterium]MCX7639867.1 protein phosphatase 2C domain-containing protein [Pyrinomonadaceae bacterium]MDW8304039.1 protein phosphatase 2C domain-containing protein [Acidobacteriota bacterium]
MQKTQIISAGITDRGLNERRFTNEDSFLNKPEYGIFAVADGVGGAQAGEVASGAAIDILAEAFANLRPEDDAEEVMKRAIKKANEYIYQMSRELPRLSGMATTIVALHISGNIATIGHVGDSRLYRLDPRGNIFRETQDHSVVEEEVRAGRMTLAQAANHPARNVISRAIGAEENVEVDLKTIMIEPNTTFLLCSDGITRHIEDYEIREILLENPDPEKACEKMKQICYRRGAEDNLTAIVVKVGAVTQEAEEEEEKTISSARVVEGAPTVKLEMPEEIQMTSESLVETETQTSLPQAKSIQNEDKIKKRNGIFVRFLWMILLIILGGILGVVLYHFSLLKPVFQQDTAQMPQFPVTPVMQTPNIEYTAFEDNRRNVDADPEKYIELSEKSAQTAEDFYLLGRAYLLTGKYQQAKRAFEMAKERLFETREINRVVLETEIAMGLAVVENEVARREFANQRKLLIENSRSLPLGVEDTNVSNSENR